MNLIIYKNELCNICNKSKEVIHDNKLYKCCNCILNLCPICKLKHNKEHKLIDYELINYLCNIYFVPISFKFMQYM